jgi:hypothetical protein
VTLGCTSSETTNAPVADAQSAADAQPNVDARANDAAVIDDDSDGSLVDAEPPNAEASTGFQLCSGRGRPDAGNPARLVLFAAARAGGLWGLGDAVKYQNGQSYLYVTDDCSYWVMPGAWRGVYHGILQPADAQALAADLSVGQLAMYAGEWSGVGASDTPVLHVTDGKNLVQCGSRCDQNPAVPEAVTHLYGNYLDWLERLVEGGSALTGAMRMTLVHIENIDPKEVYFPVPLEWPFAQPPEELAVRGSELMGERYYGQLVDDIGVLEVLRDLRVRKLNDEFYGDEITIADDEEERFFRLTFRDVTPYEDEEGFLPTTF